MDGDTMIGFLLAIWFGLAFLIAYVAKEKHRDGASWMLIALVFSPLLALLALCALPMGDLSTKKASSSDNTGKGYHPMDCVCPNCLTWLDAQRRKLEAQQKS
jgi:hypothetical protein